MVLGASAIHGYPFCKAAREAFSLLSKNVLRVAAINCVGDFVIFMAKVGVIAGTTLIGYEILKASCRLGDLLACRKSPATAGSTVSYLNPAGLGERARNHLAVRLEAHTAYETAPHVDATFTSILLRYTAHTDVLGSVS